jgi:glycerol-3-phosphate acyltransferase PlsY
MTMPMLAVVAAYLIGGIPWGLLLGRWLRGIDIRQHGSGKTGATNAARTLGWRISGIVFLLDVVKGLLAVLLARWLTGLPLVEALAGIAAIVGHCWSPYIRLGGGRGVSSGFGATLALSPAVMLLVAVVGITGIRLTRYVSLGSIFGAIAVPIGLLVSWQLGLSPVEHLLYGCGGGLVILIKHIDNIQRLLAGTERKLGDRTATTTSVAKEQTR